MKNTVLLSFALAPAFALFACGQVPEKEPIGATPQGQTVVNSSAWSVYSINDLPRCDGSRVGQLYFVESLDQFKVCRSSGWETLDMRGRDGAVGATGATGTTGATGATGASGGPGTVVSSRFGCISIDGGWTLQYETVRFADNSLFVSCKAAGAAAQSSFALFYAGGTNGATSGYCQVTFDTEGDKSYGGWTFTLSPLKVVYEDYDSASDGHTFEFPSYDCHN